MIDPHVDRLAKEFSDAFAKLSRQGERHFLATVTATSPLQVQVDGDTTSQIAAYLRSYWPQSIGDRVLCMHLRGELIVTDLIAADSSGTVDVLPSGALTGTDSTTADYTASAPGDATASGATGKAADAGHKHGREAWGTAAQIGSETFGAAASAGSSGAVADAAHVHSMPALDSTAGDIAALGIGAAGSTGKAADAGHVHPTTGLITSGAAAGGDLSGTLPNPTVARVNGTSAIDIPILNELNAAGVTASEIVKVGKFAGAYTTGGVIVTFATAFPNSMDGAVAISELAASPIVALNRSSSSAAKIAIKVYAASGSEIANGTTVNFSYIAFGH